MGRVVDIPQIKVEIMVQVRPIKIAGFRPNMSDALPQRTAVVHCERENTAEVMPAHFATSFFFMPKLSIISGCEMLASYEGGVLSLTRYGKTEVMATGSANLHIALCSLVCVPRYIKSSQGEICKVSGYGVSRTSIRVTKKKRIGFSARPEFEQTGFHNFKSNLKSVDFLQASSRNIFQNFGSQICPITPHSLLYRPHPTFLKPCHHKKMDPTPPTQGCDV